MTQGIEARIATQVMMEQRYLSLKGYMGHRRDGRRAALIDGRVLRRYVRVNYVVSVISFTSISILIFLFKTGGDYGQTSLSGITFLAMVYSFFISMYNSLLLYNSVMDNGLLKPVEAMQSSYAWKVMMYCYLLYYGSASFFVSMPVIILDYYFSGSISFLPSAIMWAVTMVFLGQAIGLGIGIFASRSSRTRISRHSGMVSIVRLGLIIAAFSLLELVLFAPAQFTGLPDLGYGSYFLFIIGIPYILFYSGNTISATFLGITASFAYMALFIYLSIIITKKASEKLVSERIIAHSEGSKVRSPARKGILRAVISKDLAYTLRNSYNAMILVIPALVAVPLIIPYVNGGYAGSDPLGVMLTMFSLSSICASFFAFASLLSESEGINVLKTTPVPIRKLIYTKYSFDSLVFLVFMIPLTFTALYFVSAGWVYYFLVPATLFLAFSYTNVINLRRFFLKIPEEATRITPDSFGGNIGLMYTFFTTFLLTIIPSLVGSQLYGAIYRPFSVALGVPNYSQEIFIDLLLEAAILFFVVLVVRRQKKLSISI
ncbi:MAG: hypothetical protein M1267_00765 [Candidatus Thermoplasmatota archaeon]|jgi:predicted permease|nr:hypothetical protein [Candidatus Thermoplasmatota archaeon]